MGKAVTPKELAEKGFDLKTLMKKESVKKLMTENVFRSLYPDTTYDINSDLNKKRKRK